MIEILKVLFKKKRNPYDIIKSHIKIFEGDLHHWCITNDFNSPSMFHWKLAVKIGEQEDYLNRFLNAEFHTNIFDYKLEPVISMDNDFVFLNIIGNNLKSELILLDIPYKKINILFKNYKRHTYIIKDKSVNMGNINVYSLRALIDNKEIYVLKGNENGI